ncbi:MAG: hypothetical protein HQK60_19350, partial [Deltaproteobacteria bacterium]|nr:hypothetical protein [Deltaproteobacteria bacterium]
LSLGQVNRAIKELRDAGLIIVKSRGFMQGLEYHPVLEPQNKPCSPEKPVVARQSPTLKSTVAQDRPTDHQLEVAAQPERTTGPIKSTSVPMRSTNELETPIQGSPVNYIKENNLKEKRQTNTARPEP